MDKPKLLVVEDEEAIRSQMKWALNPDYQVILAENRICALEQMRQERPSLVLMDLGLPPSPRTAEEGLKCLCELLEVDGKTKVIVITGNQSKENALKAIDQGAFDFFLKPADFQEVKVVLKRALKISDMERENLALKMGDRAGEFGEFIGECPPIKRIFAVIKKVAKTDAPVLIEGESGTGKELIANAIHRSGDGFKDRPFIAINCGAIPDNLLESELFGHEKGSFTGADSQRKGRIEYAAGGTLFLDEVGELPLLLQVKLLRFLQEFKLERVGGRETVDVNVRVIAATNRELKKEVSEGRFREDLYYRLGVVNIVAPPLRERGEDIVLLANHFVGKFSEQYQRKVIGFRTDSLVAMKSYAWPGNIRELENRIKRAVIMSEKKILTPGDLELPQAGGEETTDSLKEVRGQVEREHILKTLWKCEWNISKAAQELEISRPTLHDFIKKHRLVRGAD
ncbi:MAG TPA: PEP-CTERM-box response regulator transcription factor [Candidatus Deferrimicrobiaceae bacterium]|jgi:two-component system NtrC family response regulator